MKPLLMLGGAALLAWYFLSKNAGSLGYSIGTPAPSGGTGTPAPPPTGTPSQLASIYAAVLAASNNQSTMYTRDQWNYFGNQVCGGCMPAPGDVWGAVETGSYDPNQLISLQDYWSKMQPFLASKGMSGLGFANVWSV